MKKNFWLLLLVSYLSATEVTFDSEDTLRKSLTPYSLTEITNRIDSVSDKKKIYFALDYNASGKNVIEQRKKPLLSLLSYEIYKTGNLTVYQPKTPRVLNHLTIALNRQVSGISDVTIEENLEIFQTINKIAEIYKTLSISGFVLAQYDVPQEGHINKFVIEIIPHLPGFNDIKNIVDKVDCNRYVVFRSSNLTPVDYKIDPKDIKESVEFWRYAFKQDQEPLTEEDLQIAYPHIRKDAYEDQADLIVKKHLTEIFKDKGATVTDDVLADFKMPKTITNDVKEITVNGCPFCSDKVIKKQLIYEYNDIYVLYVFTKGQRPGSKFLITPKRHTEKVYNLSEDEVNSIALLRKALVKVLNRVHPDLEVIMYIQDSPSVGQTAFHSNEHIIAIDPKTIDLWWSLMCLYSPEKVSDQEMKSITKQFRLMLDEEIKLR